MKTVQRLIIIPFLITRSSSHSARDTALLNLLWQRQNDQAHNLRLFHEDSSLHPHHRNLRTDYINACHDPALLYEGTGASGSCVCDEEFLEVDRILCLVEGIQCHNMLCTQETDTWIFDKSSGRMKSRSTCVLCAEESENCEGFDDTCFHAEFNEQEDMTRCSLILQDFEPVVACIDCDPCMVNGRWGMSFDCFEGRWSVEECVVGSRIGHFPAFPERGEHDFVLGHANGGKGSIIMGGRQTPKVTQSDHKEDGFFGSMTSTMYTGTIIFAATLFGVSIGICASVRWNRRRLVDEGHGQPKNDTQMLNPEEIETQVHSNVQRQSTLPANRPVRNSTSTVPAQRAEKARHDRKSLDL